MSISNGEMTDDLRALKEFDQLTGGVRIIGSPGPGERRGHQAHRARKYGLTVEELEQMLEEHSGICDICGVTLDHTKGRGVGAAHIDHDHETGKIRGILCNNCNTGLGMFKDDVKFLVKAIIYLGKTDLDKI